MCHTECHLLSGGCEERQRINNSKYTRLLRLHLHPLLLVTQAWLTFTMSLQNLKDVLADLIPKEQTRIKNFKQQHGKTNIGQITVDMVSRYWAGSKCNRLHPKCDGCAFWQPQELTSGLGLGGEGHWEVTGLMRTGSTV